MAKNGKSDKSRDMPPRGGRDLGKLVVPATGEENQVFGETQAQLRCGGCGARLKKGFEFITVEVVQNPVTLDKAVGVFRKVACVRPECGYAVKCAETATAIRKLEYLFLDDPRVQAMMGEAAVADKEPEQTG